MGLARDWGWSASWLSAPASRRLLDTIMVVISSSVNPAACSASAISGSPSSTGGLCGWPRSVVMMVCSAPVARMLPAIRAHSYLPVNGVVKQRSRNAPCPARASWSSRLMSCCGNSGWVAITCRTPASNAASATARLSYADRWPVATTSWCRAASRSTSRVAGSGRPDPSRTSTTGTVTPWASRSRCRASHIGGVAPGGRSACLARWLAASRVGIHKIRAPSRAAISTATGLSPPTDALSVRAPSTRTPPGSIP